jgi:hypothetical protein
MFKDYLIFRVDKDSAHSRELCGESHLEAEALRFAELSMAMEHEKASVFFEVRLASPDSPDTGALIDIVDHSGSGGRLMDDSVLAEFPVVGGPQPRPPPPHDRPA